MSIYRSEIDGLRALAVLAVILFHAEIPYFSGGFVGVDVFFVISGYLITSIILNENQAGNFSIVQFYARRARRILPALFFMLLLCVPLAWILLLPDQLLDFSKNLEAIPLFISNLFLWKNTSYFSANAAENPFIHTWSLGIEEQYYLFFPLLMLIFWKIGHKKLMLLTAGLLLCSISTSEYLVQHHPTAAFFFTFSRAWELLVGSTLAFVFFKNVSLKNPLSSQYNQFLSGLGLFLIAFSIFYFNKNMAFPGLHALVPIVGTALILSFTTNNTLVYKSLTQPYLVQLGLISYSVYLWHQPLFALARIYFFEKPALNFWLIPLTIAFGFFTWKYIEQPFRNKNRFSSKHIFIFSLSGSLLFVSIGLVGHLMQGFPKRLSPYQKALFSCQAERNIFNEHLGCFLNEKQNETNLGSCTFTSAGRSDILLWGDSFAAHLMPGLQAESRYRSLRQFTSSSCLPILNHFFANRPACQAINTTIMQRIKQNPPDTVLLAGRWEASQPYWRQLKNTIQQLKIVGVRNIILIGPPPIWDTALPHILARLNQPFQDLPQRITRYVSRDIFVVDQEMQDLAQSWKIQYISLASLLCNQQGCLTRLGQTPDYLMSFDDGHFTRKGSQYVVSHLAHQYTFLT